MSLNCHWSYSCCNGLIAFYLQTSMAFFKDQENVVSAAMTVTQNLMDQYQIDPRSIGRCFLHYNTCMSFTDACPQMHVHKCICERQ